MEYARIVALPTEGVPALIDKALPQVTKDVAVSTKKQYSYCAGLLKEVFAEFRPNQVKHGDIVQMMDLYLHSPMTANRMLTVLKLVYQWALDRELVETNPCLTVKRLPQGKRNRLITPEEYQRIYAVVAPWLQVVMDLCYLTGQRIGDVLKIEHAHLLDEGIFVDQQKTGKRLIVAWTPQLRDVVARAKALGTPVRSMKYLVAGRAGKMRLHSNVWRSFKEAARSVGLGDVTLHDLRAMSGTDADRQGKDPSALLGHTDRRTTEIYLRDKSAKVVQGPTKKVADATTKKAG
ncbi:tyrosine-type recombinase/integrase [Paracandidimonas lactea]|uniref:tyrosine-type recombinase/integrase n=1 Tax=Paracandidimonas lactea TaxID=2895524 RepID=UPI001EFF8EC4|nr:tyrosine-type recombinase/integrase [Paracandidimonas lactea]